MSMARAGGGAGAVRATRRIARVVVLAVLAMAGMAQVAAAFAAPVRGIAGVRFAFKVDAAIRSTPAVAEGRVFFGASDGAIYAIDASSGALRWRFATGGAVDSSPAVARGIVYAASRDGHLYAVGAGDGRLRWRLAFGPELGDDHYWDYSLSSPRVVDGTVYVGAGDGRVYAVAAASGRVRWSFDAQGRVRAPPAVDAEADTIVVGTTRGIVVALSRRDGRERRRFVTDGASHRFEDAGNDTTSIVSEPLIAGGAAFVGSRDAHVYALDLATGKLLWKRTHDGSSWILSITGDASRLVIGSGSAKLVEAANPRDGASMWRFRTTAFMMAPVRVTGDVVYAVDFEGNVHALDAASGTPYWSVPIGARALAAPVESGGIVYCASDEGVLYALDGTSSARAPRRRLVYREPPPRAGAFRWFEDHVAASIGAQFEAAGYERVDAEGLAAAMRAQVDGTQASMVVLADNRLPRSVGGTGADDALIRRYLDAGGTVALLGANPLAFRENPETGEVDSIDVDVPRRIFSIDYAEPSRVNGYYPSKPTESGRRAGLRDTGVAEAAIDPAAVTTVLARNELGMATAWVKRYGGGPGTGLVTFSVPRSAATSVLQYRRALELLP